MEKCCVTCSIVFGSTRHNACIVSLFDDCSYHSRFVVNRLIASVTTRFDVTVPDHRVIKRADCIYSTTLGEAVRSDDWTEVDVQRRVQSGANVDEHISSELQKTQL